MSVYSLSVGLVVRRGSRTLEFDRRLEDGTVVFIDQADRSPARYAIGALAREIADGKLQVISGARGKAGAGDTVSAMVCDLNALDERYVDELTVRLRIVNGLRRAGLRRGMRRAIQRTLPAVVRDLPMKAVPSASTVMQWWRRIEIAGGNNHAAVNLNAVRSQPKRLSAAVESVIARTIKAEYCNRERRSMTHVVALATQQLRSLADAGTLPEGAAKVSLTTVSRRVAEIDGFALDASRYGPAFARRKWRESYRGVHATRAFERFEVDHTLLDIVVVCDRTGLPLGRPTITVIVDAYSGYVVSFFISFWGTGIAPTLSALKQAILPKDQFTREAFGLENEWLGYGICEQLVVDNGLEFHSPQFLRVAAMLNSDVKFCAVRQPWMKPVIERTMGTLNSYLPAQGRVERRIDNYLPINPDQSAAITFSALCLGLLKAFVDVHAFEVNDRKLATPYELFEDSIQRVPPPNLPADLSQLEVLVAPSKELTASGEGVIFEYLRYNSRELQAMRRRVGERFRATVKLQYEDLGTVFVQDPMTKRWLQVPSCHPEYTSGLSLVQHRAIRRFRQERLKERDAIGELLRRKAALAAFWVSHVPRRRHRASTVIQRMAGLTSAQVLASVSGDHGCTRAPEAIVCEADLKMPTREIVAFDAMSLD
jgi:putative transposase